MSPPQGEINQPDELRAFCRGFLERLPATGGLNRMLSQLQAACVRVTRLPVEDWNLDGEATAWLVSAQKRWPDGRVPLSGRSAVTGEPVLETSTGDALPLPDAAMRTVCRAWLSGFADDDFDDALGLQATRDGCLKITERAAGAVLELTEGELAGVRWLVQTMSDMQDADAIGESLIPLRQRTALGEALDTARLGSEVFLGHAIGIGVSWLVLSTVGFVVIVWLFNPFSEDIPIAILAAGALGAVVALLLGKRLRRNA